METTKQEERRQITEMRQLLGLTQAEVAQGMRPRISHSKLSLYENGIVDLAPKEYEGLKKFLSRPQKHPRPGFVAMNAGNFDEQFEAWQEAKSVERRTVYRKQTGMSLREFGLVAKIPRNRLCNWEAGTAALNPEEYARWEKVVREGRSKQDLADPWSRLKSAYSTIQELLAERRRFLSGLEGLTRIDDPVISEIIESFRREIAELEQQSKRSVESKTEGN